MRATLALLLSFPIYYVVDFGWTWVCVILLQVLAGLNFKFGDN
jgi:hypothetical protein